MQAQFSTTVIFFHAWEDHVPLQTVPSSCSGGILVIILHTALPFILFLLCKHLSISMFWQKSTVALHHAKKGLGRILIPLHSSQNIQNDQLLTLTPSCASTLAPASNSACATGRWPYSLAWWRGVFWNGKTRRAEDKWRKGNGDSLH